MNTSIVNIKNQNVLEVLGKLRAQLATLYGEKLARLILFGSQARGEAKPDSDIDVLVVLKGAVNPGDEIDRTGEITAALSLKCGVVISCVFISLERFTTEQSPLLLNVRQEGINL